MGRGDTTCDLELGIPLLEAFTITPTGSAGRTDSEI